MRSISKFKMLVHPDYVAMNDEQAALGLHPLQIKLRRAWDQEVREIKRREDVLFLYVSVLQQQMISRGIRDIDSLKHPAERDDIGRIIRYEGELGSKFVLIPNRIAVTTSLLEDEMTRREVVLGNDPELEVFGEFYGAGFTCVESWGRECKLALGVKDDKYSVLEDLCFRDTSYRGVREWQEQRNINAEKSLSGERLLRS